MFNEKLTLKMEIHYSTTAQVQLYNMQGHLVLAKKDVKLSSGLNDLSFDVGGLAPNIYLLVLNTDREQFKMKVIAK